ncbi:MAG: OmpA family protein [Saprospiraceae bacterium]|nr:OmpA family protein [Saprospiraceae bacterium]
MQKILFLAILLFGSVCVYSQTPDSDLQEVLRKLDRGESVEHMLIRLSDINFATGTATLESGAKTYLDQVARLLRSVPNMQLAVKGHADNTGSRTVNEKLSTDRALAVRDYLLAQHILSSRLTATGFGSTQPLVENTTAEGRAQNRRVELEILKTEQVKQLQDIIVLRNGEKRGGIIRTYDQRMIRYRQFSEVQEKEIAIGEVEMIVFADGRIVRFDQPAPKTSAPKPANGYQFRPFATSAAFHPGQFVLGLGIGVDNNVGIRYRENSISVPPVWVVMELPLKHNIGVGVSGGWMQWSPKGSDESTLRYFSFSPRVAYHFNLVEQVDLYTGVAISGRFASLDAERPGGAVHLLNSRFDVSMFCGLRYYFNRAFGIMAEYGGDQISCARLGLALRFGR